MLTYTIEKEPVTAARKGKYPWADLKVGESFVVPCVNLRSRQRSIRHSAATWASRNDPARRFATRSGRHLDIPPEAAGAADVGSRAHRPSFAACSRFMAPPPQHINDKPKGVIL